MRVHIRIFLMSHNANIHYCRASFSMSLFDSQWHIPIPTEGEEGAFYDIILGVSTKNLNIDAIESVLIKFDQLQSIDEGYEYEVGIQIFYCCSLFSMQGDSSSMVNTFLTRCSHVIGYQIS